MAAALESAGVAGYMMQLRQGQTTLSLPYRDAQFNWDTDPPRAWTPDQVFQISSLSKLITSMGMIQILNQSGASVNDDIYNYLPVYWQKHSSLRSIQIADLLRHQSGFRNINAQGVLPANQYDPGATTGPLPGTSGPGWSIGEYVQYKALACLGVEEALIGSWAEIHLGIPLVYGQGSPYWFYLNENFGMIRVIISYFTGAMDSINQTDQPWDPVADYISIASYKSYINTSVFGAANVSPSRLNTLGTDSLTYATIGDVVTSHGFADLDGTEDAGFGGWRLSMNDVMKAMGAFVRGDILGTSAPPSAAPGTWMNGTTAIENGFGIDDVVSVPNWGTYYDKNGGTSYSITPFSGPNVTAWNQCIFFYMPENIDFAVFVNSNIGASAKQTITLAQVNNNTPRLVPNPLTNQVIYNLGPAGNGGFDVRSLVTAILPSYLDRPPPIPVHL